MNPTADSPAGITKPDLAAVPAQQVIELESSDATIARELAALHEESATHAYAHIFDEPFPRRQTVARWATYTGHLAVARREGRMMGFVVWQDGELCALYVLPADARTGVGSALLSAAAEAQRLWVLEQNLVAQQFYRRHGWHPSGAVRRVWGGADELEYRWEHREPH